MCNKLFLQKKKKIKNIEKKKKKTEFCLNYFEGGFNYCTYNLYIQI